MSRPLRLQFEGAFYHVMSRGNERKPIFRDDKDREAFLGILKDTQQTYCLIIHAYVLMTNHYHLLLETPQANLSLAMRQINGVYTRYFNYQWKRFGHLFQSRFKSLLVDKDSYLLTLSRYIHQNPLKARLVRRLEDYPWSSYLAYVGLTKAPSWLFLQDTLSYFESIQSDGIKSYRAFVQAQQEKDPYAKAVAGSLLGSVDFVSKMTSNNKQAHSSEYSRRRELERLCGADSVLELVCRSYGIRQEDLVGGKYKRLEARAMVMYLLRNKTSLSLPDIARRLNITYSGVAQSICRLKKKTFSDLRWRNKLAVFEGELAEKYKVKT